MKVNHVIETCLYATDLEATKTFYQDVLGIEFYAEVEGRHAFFRCGSAMFLVFNPEATCVESDKGIPVPTHGATGEGHVAFEMAMEDLESWREHLESRGVEIELDLTWPNGGRSFYFRDPARNSIELTTRKTWGLD